LSLKRIVLVFGILVGVAVLGGVAFYFAIGAPPSGSNWVIPSRSMDPALRAGERVIADPRVRPVQGSIVVYAAPNASKVLAGRVVATGGQTVDLQDGRVTIDGRSLDEPYTQGRTTLQISPTVTFPVKVPAGSLWILGDNREASADSRLFGAVPESSVRGVVTRVYWPLKSFRVVATSR
jgi:signal peptidase I